MSIITFETYVEAVQQKYLKDIGGELSTFLAKPTSGQLKEACIDVLGKIKNNSDQNILQRFFELGEEEDEYIKTIKKFDNDKLKPIVNFLKGNTDSIQSSVSLELVAILIDFKPRPYSSFKEKSNDVDPKNKRFRDKVPKIKPEERVGINSIGRTKHYIKAITITLSIVLILLTIVYFGFDRQQKDCMVWDQDHYKSVNCKNNNSLQIAYNQDLIENFKKAKIDTIETFFKKGDTLYWYYITDGEIELFTYEGKHPISRKSLKPITEYIVRKYVDNEDL